MEYEDKGQTWHNNLEHIIRLKKGIEKMNNRKDMFKKAFQIFRTNFEALTKAEAEEKALTLKMDEYRRKYSSEYFKTKYEEEYKKLYDKYVKQLNSDGDILSSLFDELKQSFLNDTIDLESVKLSNAISIITNGGLTTEELFDESNAKVIEQFRGNLPTLKMLENIARQKDMMAAFDFSQYIFDAENEFTALKYNVDKYMRSSYTSIPHDSKWGMHSMGATLKKLAVKAGVELSDDEMKVVADETAFAFLDGMLDDPNGSMQNVVKPDDLINSFEE